MDVSYNPSADDRAPRSLVEYPELRPILAHLGRELTRPLIALRTGSAQLLADPSGLGGRDQQGHLQMLVTLCDDLLQMTRGYLEEGLLRGTRPLSYGTFTLGALVGEVDRQFGPEARRRRLGWRCTLEGPDANVVTDACRFQHVIDQLVTNALRFTPEGGTVEVLARQDGHRWAWTVTDDGPGIPKEFLEKVFEPFFRLLRDDRAGLAGQGIGLAICRELVEQIQGQIRLDSPQGQGTRVELRFPTVPSRPAAGPGAMRTAGG